MENLILTSIFLFISKICSFGLHFDFNNRVFFFALNTPCIENLTQSYLNINNYFRSTTSLIISSSNVANTLSFSNTVANICYWLFLTWLMFMTWKQELQISEWLKLSGRDTRFSAINVGKDFIMALTTRQHFANKPTSGYLFECLHVLPHMKILYRVLFLWLSFKLTAFVKAHSSLLSGTLKQFAMIKYYFEVTYKNVTVHVY